MAGTIVCDVISDGAGNSTATDNAIYGSAKAWVNFGYVSSAITIRASYNVSSVTRSGTGLYTVNLTNALVDTNYATNVTAARYAYGTISYACSGFSQPISTSSVYVYTGYEDSFSGQEPTDSYYCYVAINR